MLYLITLFPFVVGCTATTVKCCVVHVASSALHKRMTASQRDASSRVLLSPVSGSVRSADECVSSRLKCFGARSLFSCCTALLQQVRENTTGKDSVGIYEGPELPYHRAVYESIYHVLCAGGSEALATSLAA